MALLGDHGSNPHPPEWQACAAANWAGAERSTLELDGNSRVLAFVTEGPEVPS